MASPQKENGYTPIANELLEAFLLYKFPKNTGDAPRLLWLFIARKTFGFSKKEDCISLTQFEKNTNIRRGTIVHWLNYLVQAKLLVRANEPTKNGFAYTINKDYDTWLPLVQARRLVQARIVSSALASTKTSALASTHINKKQINKNKGFKNSLTLPEWLNKETWAEWEQHRKEIGKKLTPLTITKQLNILSEHKDQHEQIIQQSIQHGWTGLFKPKTKKITLKKEVSERRKL